MSSAIKNFAKRVWGDFQSREELVRFLHLAVTMCLIIGTYWGLRVMKDSIFNAVVGGTAYLPQAKMLSLLISAPIVIFYGKLVDWFSRQRVFYILSVFYFVTAVLFAIAFMHPATGLANTVASPDRWIGWAWYVWVESFGSLMVALFWAFTADITDPEAAKRGFPLIALFAQIGNMIFPTILSAKTWGFENSAPVVGMCAGFIGLIAVSFWLFVHWHTRKELSGYGVKAAHEPVESEPGFLEGLWLLLSQGYLLGLFAIIFIYEVIVTVFDYHFKSSVFEIMGNEKAVNAYLSSYASWVGLVGVICIVFGINNIQRLLGMKWSLLTLPALVGVAILALKTYPTHLAMAFWIMVFSKAINYALNQPTLKQLYIPTSKDAKYKSQAWIEMFGGRSSKGTGSIINSTKAGLFSGNVHVFLMVTSLLSFGLIGVWVLVALFVSKKYDKAIKENKVVC